MLLPYVKWASCTVSEICCRLLQATHKAWPRSPALWAAPKEALPPRSCPSQGFSSTSHNASMPHLQRPPCHLLISFNTFRIICGYLEIDLPFKSVSPCKHKLHEFLSRPYSRWQPLCQAQDCHLIGTVLISELLLEHTRCRIWKYLSHTLLKLSKVEWFLVSYKHSERTQGAHCTTLNKYFILHKFPQKGGFEISLCKGRCFPFSCRGRFVFCFVFGT